MPRIPIISGLIDAIRGAGPKSKSAEKSALKPAKPVSAGTTDPAKLLELARAENARGDAVFDLQKDNTKAEAHYKKALEYCSAVTKKTDAHNVELARASYRIAVISQDSNKTKIYFSIARKYLENIPVLNTELNFNYINIKAKSAELGKIDPPAAKQTVVSEQKPSPPVVTTTAQKTPPTFAEAKSELQRITKHVFIHIEPAAPGTDVTGKTKIQQLKTDLARQLKTLRVDLDNDKINPQEKAAKVEQAIPEIQSIIDKIKATGVLLITFESKPIDNLRENLSSLQNGYANEPKITSTVTQATPTVSASTSAPVQPTAAKIEPPTTEQARKQAFDTMRAFALSIGSETQKTTLPERQTSLFNAYKLLQAIPDREKTVQDLSRLMTCANMLGQVLHDLKDPRALDVVQKMGINYCAEVAAKPENNFFHYLRDVDGMARQFHANPVEMKRFIFAKADAYEQSGQRYLEQKNPEKAAACFEQARVLCQQGIPEQGQVDDVIKRIERYQLAETKAKAANQASTRKENTSGILHGLYTNAQLTEIAEAKKTAALESRTPAGSAETRSPGRQEATAQKADANLPASPASVKDLKTRDPGLDVEVEAIIAAKSEPPTFRR